MGKLFQRATAICVALSGALIALADDQPAEPGPPEGSPAAESTGGRIRGQVVLDQGGAPVADAQIILERQLPGRGADPGRWQTTTDGDGRFTFDRLGGGRYFIRAAHEKLSSLQRARGDGAIRIGMRNETAMPLELRLRPGVAVKVRVVEKDGGKPVAGARVHLTGS